MRLLYFYHGHRLHRLARHQDFSLFELAIWLHTLARSLVSVFVPILLLQTGYPIRDVLIYYLVFNLIDVPLNFAVDRLMRRVGARKVMMLGTVTLIAYFGILGVLPAGSWLLLLFLAFLAAAYDTLFWISYIYMFIETNRAGLDTGKSVGALQVVRKLASIAGPLVGALVLLVAGKSFLVLASIAIFAMSILPLYKIRHVNDKPATKQPSIREFLSGPQEKRDYLALALWGVHGEIDDVLWPIFIFSVFGSIGSVAAVPVIVAVTTIGFSYLAGRLSKAYSTSMMLVGTALIACSWILRLLVPNPVFYYVTIVIVGLLSLLVSIPLDSNITARGLKTSSLAASTMRNTASMVLRVPLYLILLLLVEVFKVSFVMAAASLFFMVPVILFFRNPAVVQSGKQV